MLFLSQSESNDWAGCNARAFARWVLEHRPLDNEDRPRRVGSMGHAIVNEVVAAQWAGRTANPWAAIGAEAKRRGWDMEAIEDDEFACAAKAAEHLTTAIDLPRMRVLPDLYSDAGAAGNGLRGPLAEVRLRVSWRSLETYFLDAGDSCAAWRDIKACSAVMQRFAGIEGQPDLVCMPANADGGVVVLDYKFRQKPDPGTVATEAEAAVPDRQAAWYQALIHGAGLRPAGGLEFWQVNVYAGRWLTVDDFLDAASNRAATETQYNLVTSSGLPTRDLKRLADAGGMVTADVWAEAHRVLADQRLVRRLDEWRTPKYTPTGNLRKQGDPPDRLSATEAEDAQRFVADLARFNPVSIRRFRVEPSVCREVVRDMIVGVDGPLGQALRGMRPARHLQTYKTSPCVRPYGCPIQTPCMASIGTSTFEAALGDLSDQAAVQRAAAGPAFGTVAAALE